MRILAIFLLILPTCCAQSDQSSVEAVLKQLERADQTGDFNAYLNLWTREKVGDFEKMRPYATPRPEVRYRTLKTFVRGDDAVVLVERGSDSFVTLTLRQEGGQWKFKDQVFRDTAPNPNSVYAILPPDPGAFMRAGSRWNQVAPAMDPGHAARLGWEMKAVFDESYLYIRIESSANLPSPGSTVATSPAVWPVLKIDTSDAGGFVLYDAVNIGDQATFDEHGHANSHRPYVSYMIRLEQRGQELFSAAADLNPSKLLEVAGQDYDIRIPLRAMGITDSRATRITIGDAQWPKSAVVSFAVQRYPR